MKRAQESAEETPSPEGWVKRLNTNLSREYYVNIDTTLTQWERPPRFPEEDTKLPDKIIPTMTDSSNPQPSVRMGLAKRVLSGDSIVLQETTSSGQKKEITIQLSCVAASRFANSPTDLLDEPFAWEAREFLRKKIIGKEVAFEKVAVGRNWKEFGRLYFAGEANEPTDIAVCGVREGWLKVTSKQTANAYIKNLLALQGQAKGEKRGRWSNKHEECHHIRNIKWTMDDPISLLAKHNRKSIQAVVEEILDGGSVRVFLLPSFEYVTVMLSGIQVPILEEGEEYAEEAKNFVEERLLQRDVNIVLYGCIGKHLIGLVLHPERGNIAKYLLEEGYAKCNEKSLEGMNEEDVKELRNAEREAKEKRLRLWKTYNLLEKDAEAFKQHDSADFLRAAEKYANESLPDLIQACEKGWLAAHYVVKIYYLELGLYLASHRSLTFATRFAIELAASKPLRFWDAWGIAGKMHRFAYGSGRMTKESFLRHLAEVAYFVEHFPQLDKEKVGAALPKLIADVESKQITDVAYDRFDEDPLKFKCGEFNPSHKFY